MVDRCNKLVVYVHTLYKYNREVQEQFQMGIIVNFVFYQITDKFFDDFKFNFRFFVFW
jgi:hypothetical protein